MPFTHGETIHASEIDVAVAVARMPVEVPPAKIGETDEAIARHCAAYIGDGCVIQTGVGAVPDAILRQLGDRKDLGVHSGMLGDGLVDLIEARRDHQRAQGDRPRRDDQRRADRHPAALRVLRPQSRRSA